MPVKGRAGPLHGEPHLLCLLGRAVLVPVASDLWGVVVPQEGHAQVGKTVPEVASTGEAETRISACSRADLTLCCRRDRRGFCEECLRLKDYEIYGFAVLAADRAGCGFADALVGCTGGVLVPPFSAYPQR